MPFYECNENQFVENVRRLLDAKHSFVVNRRISMFDDQKYGLSTIPDQEFEKYAMICERKGFKYTAYARVPFVDDFHSRFYSAGDALHASSNLEFPRLSMPYYKVEYSFNLWGSTYFHSFDALFKPKIALEKKSLPKRKAGRSGALVHVLHFEQPKEETLALNLPSTVMVMDVKKMNRVFDF